MAHIEQKKFCKKIKEKYPEYFKNKVVLDIGSLDINGNNRFLFEDCIYIGIDLDQGSNVDIVSSGHLYGALDNSFDLIISTEVFEHDMFYKETIKNVMRMLKVGGMFIFTCASVGRVEHGTIKSDSTYAAPLLQNISSEWANYYKNLTEIDIRNIEGVNENFPDAYFEYNSASCDLYFFGIKGGNKYEEIDIKLNLKENRIILEPKKDFSGYLEIFNWNPNNNLTNIIYDKSIIDIKPGLSYWFQPVTDFTKLLGLLVIIRDIKDNVVKEKKFNSNLNSIDDKLQTLDVIAIKSGTDKSSEIHNYCEKYQKYLPFERHNNLKFLEIGVLNGASLKMWSEYFYNANLVGLDINSNCKQYEENNIKIEIGSQNDINFLNYIGNKYKEFDIILDDGSHMMNDVIFSFENLFKYLKSGGIYIVEDTCTSYWNEFGGGLNKSDSAIEYFKNLVDDVNFYGTREGSSNFRKESYLENLYQQKYNIESINFMNSTIIITKR